ncbi:MAG TPA: pyridoxamine 5'-phosphate oxidase family protein [Chloroflexota bacterium]|nr:pyridoxamine 5'-phosphate oxidase family protein [Chloroflexota bacterium]
MTASLHELLAAERFGVLATHSARRPGWPFASLAPYALDERGGPVLLLSDLAEHTRNIRADARVSLLVQQTSDEEDPQAAARVTLLGMLVALPSDAAPSAREHYVARHPRAAEYAALSDFRVYGLSVTEARFIGGFGNMGWLSGEALRAVLGP